ncbi:hypothetical protein B0H13DRAFT_1866087 [Mycena leptocephala]|nr:hypothetical protein B0H13DRAFT_1866087 [Mycena leptocephala]
MTSGRFLDVNNLLLLLQDLIADPPPPPAAFLPTEYTGKPGRPRYILDIQQVHLLHDLGNSYEDIAAAMGVYRPTLYNHPEYQLEFGMQERNKWNMSVKSGTVPPKFMDTEARTRNFLQWSLLVATALANPVSPFYRSREVVNFGIKGVSLFGILVLSGHFLCEFLGHTSGFDDIAQGVKNAGIESLPVYKLNRSRHHHPPRVRLGLNPQDEIQKGADGPNLNELRKKEVGIRIGTVLKSMVPFYWARQPADRGQHFRKTGGWISNEDLSNEKRERRWMRGGRRRAPICSVEATRRRTKEKRKEKLKESRRPRVCETKAKERSRRSSRERVGWRSRTRPEAEVLESELHQIEIGINTRERCASGGGRAYDARSEIRYRDRSRASDACATARGHRASGVGGVGCYWGRTRKQGSGRWAIGKHESGQDQGK